MSEGIPWYEDEQFWQLFAPYLFDDFHWDIAEKEAGQALALLGLNPPADILDTCCGVGRHSLSLAGLGYRVTGVDRTAAFIEAAKESAESYGYPVEFVLGDIRSFSRPSSYDGAVNLFTSFGYFEDEEDEMIFLRNILYSLRDGGGLVVDLMGKEVLARIFRESDWHEEDGALVLQERKIIGSWEKMENRWIVVKDGERREYVFSLKIYSGEELKNLLLKAGFAEAACYGDLSGAPYDQTSERLVVVAKKKR